MMIRRNHRIITLSICSLLFRQMRRYAVFFRFVDALSQTSLIRAPITTTCNRIIPDQINRIPLASTASSSCIRSIGNKKISSATTQVYQRNICCSLLRCIHQRRTSSIRRFIATRKVKYMRL